MFFRGPEWLDGTKVAVFGLKMHIFATFGWVLAQKLQITNLCTFVRCLIAQFSIVTHQDQEHFLVHTCALKRY